MKSLILERFLWTLSVAAIALLLGQLHSGSRRSLPTARAFAVPEVQTYDAAQLSKVADSVASSDPFRSERNLSAAAAGQAVAAPSASPVSAPHLELSGLSGGPPWRAIMSGIPGHEGGVVVSAGDTLGGMRVRTVRRDTVILETKDSTVTFTLRR
jgi:hypothetical protein